MFVFQGRGPRPHQQTAVVSVVRVRDVRIGLRRSRFPVHRGGFDEEMGRSAVGLPGDERYRPVRRPSVSEVHVSVSVESGE